MLTDSLIAKLPRNSLANIHLFGFEKGSNNETMAFCIDMSRDLYAGIRARTELRPGGGMAFR